MRSARAPHRRLGPRIAALAVAAAMTLAGCSSGAQGAPAGSQPPTNDGPSAVTSGRDQPDAGGTSSAQASTGHSSASASSQPNASASSQPSTAPPSDGDSSATALLTAAETALDAVPDSTLISIESEHQQSRWEAQVVTSDGTEHELTLSADGTQVISGPTTENESAADKAKHRDRVTAATLDYRDAVHALLDAMPGGRIGELNLDSERGVTVWEADVYDGSGAKHEFDVNAATGKVTEQ